MHEELRAALTPVLDDVASTCPVEPQIVDHDWTNDPGQPSAMLRAPDGTEAGISVLAGQPTSLSVSSVAQQVQEWAVEALWGEGLPATWPMCPLHPNAHPLEAAIGNRNAVWCCPSEKKLIARIGEIGELAKSE